MSPISRLFYLACETKPDLPSRQLLHYLGKGWVQLLTAGAKMGIGGVLAACKDTKYEQIQSLFMLGSESGASPSIEEFKALLLAAIYEKIQEADLGAIDQAALAGELWQWSQGKISATGEYALNWTDVPDSPPFFDCGMFGINRACGIDGVPKEVITVLSKPGQGKTTIALALALSWKRLNPDNRVDMLQSEIAPGPLLYKARGMYKESDGELFVDGEDQITFGSTAIYTRLKWLVENPNPNRLVLFDSVSGYCGTGTEPSSRTKYETLYNIAMQIKNGSAAMFLFHHTKRNTDPGNLMEAAAGAAVVERFSGVMLYQENKGQVKKNGNSYLNLKLTTVKSRYGIPEPDNSFLLCYNTGECVDADEEYTEEAVENITGHKRISVDDLDDGPQNWTGQ